MKEMWNQRYSEEGFAYDTEPNDFLAEHWKPFPARGKVLCIAEGEGRKAIFLTKRGFNVTANDFSEEEN